MQFKKRENGHGGVLRLVKLQAILLYILHQLGNRVREVLSSAYSILNEITWKLKDVILFLTQGLFINFFSNSHIHNVVSELRNVIKIDMENDDAVLMLLDVVQVNNVGIDEVDLTLFNLVNFSVDKHIVLTLV